MVFAHDTEIALGGAAALVNADLPDVTALHAFFVTNGWSGRPPTTDADLHDVRALQPRLERLWHADEDEIVESVNGLLREFDALPQLVRHDNWPYHLHATPHDAPLAARMAVEAAMAMVDVVRDGRLDRLRLCERPACENVLVDLTKNRSKRFCDATCGNKEAVRAYRARKSAS